MAQRPQRGQQGGDGGLGSQRDLVGGHDDGDPGGEQGPVEGGDLPARAHDLAEQRVVEVAVLLPLILTVAEATALLSGPVTVPETCRVCANVADIMHSTEQKIKSKLFIRFCLVCLIMN